MSRDGSFQGFSRGEARTRTATTLNFDASAGSIFSKLARLPWGFILLVVAMALIGIAMLYSSAHTNPAEQHLWRVQLIRFSFFFGVMIVLALLPLSWWMNLSWIAYAGTIVLLVLTEVMGVTGGGAQRWLQIGPVAVQPSEFAKLAVTLALARYYHAMLGVNGSRFLVHIGAGAIIMVPSALVFIQPDLGTTLAIIASGGVVVFLAGLSGRIILGGIAAGAAAVWPIYQFVLEPYQRGRVDTFIAQLFGSSGASTSLGESYQIEQAKIAIGAGGLNGKGWLQGVQSQQDYVPEQHTDFILTVIAEEFGFLGATAILIGFAILLGWSLNTARQANSNFGRFAAAGAAATVAFYVVFNVAMVIGLLPVVGMPLPLISYGGTAMLTAMSCFGLILSVYMHRDDKLNTTGLF
ncbi:MAG: rod shape-determining protein RodA [Hyphomonas sp.]|uniref:rod shape-determining protein RodA n=1 Tax=Hyphomonas sp. TaxID=87 RepID=UPI003527F2FE